MATRKGSRKKQKAIDESAVLAALAASEGLKNTDLAASLGVNHLKLRDVLKSLEASGQAWRSGNTRATVWHARSGDAPAATGDAPEATGEAAPAEAAAEAPREPRRRIVRPDKPARAEALPPEKAPRKPARQRKARASKLGAFADQLGKVPDRELASMAGVSLSLVGQARRKAGIPAARTAAAAAPAPEAAPPKAPRGRRARAAEAAPALPVPVATVTNGARYVWRVSTAGDRTSLVVAPTILDAVATAERMLGEVHALERLGPVAASA